MDISFDLVLQKWPQICRNILKSFLDICFYNLGLKKSKMIKTISICQRKKRIHGTFIWASNIPVFNGFYGYRDKEYCVESQEVWPDNYLANSL